MNLIPTQEQAAIIAFAKSSKENLLIDALAGSAKTTTLTMLATALPPAPTLCLAFNKRIAEEMQRRMPGNVECATINSIGHRAWARVVGKKLFVDTKKNYSFLSSELEAMSKGQEKDLAFKSFSSLLRALALAKSSGYVPPSFRNIGRSLVEDHDALYDILAPHLDEMPSNEQFAMLDRILTKQIQASFDGKIDFDDQIYMSALFGAVFPKYYVLMVDEAQDLSPLNHEILPKLLVPERGRLIAVGDPFQSIYAFRGADSASMSRLANTFSMTRMELSVSFRCPRSVVRRAQSRAPHMKWWETSPEGLVLYHDEWSQADIPEGAAIICRNNAPLFKCALSLIKRQRAVRLQGADIGPALVKVMAKLGDPGTVRSSVFDLISHWETLQLSRARESRRAGIYDRAECMRVFAEYGATLGEAIAWAEHLFASSGSILLMTGHKAKGLEYDIVFHLDPWRIPSRYAKEAADEGDDRQLQQELNIRYVIETRAKQELHLINMKDMK